MPVERGSPNAPAAFRLPTCANRASRRYNSRKLPGDRIGAGAHEPRTNLAQLAAEYDISALRWRLATLRALLELSALNARLLHLLSYAEVSNRLPAGGSDEALWLAVRGNIGRLADVTIWLHICREAIDPVIEDPARALPESGRIASTGAMG